MTQLTREELTTKAGVDADFLDRLMELGIIRPAAGTDTFSVGAFRATRMVKTLEQGGLPLDGIGAAVRSGQVSFEFLDLPAYDRFSELSGTTFQSFHEQTGIPLPLLQAMREAIGLARPEPDDLVRDDELGMAPALQMTLALGIEPSTVERFMHVYADNLRRIVDSESAWYRTYLLQPLIDRGMTEAEALTVAGQFGSEGALALERVLVGVYQAQQEQSWTRSTFEVVENALDKAGLWAKLTHPPAMSFLDLSGFTRLTEERGDAAAAELAATLGRSVQRISRAHGGTPVKWLGDGVMVHFDEPGPGVVAALEMVEQVPAEGLPPARVGIDAGPVFFQDGDYFGRTVNVAARIAAYASPDEVLVSDAVFQAGAVPGCRFDEVGPTDLKGVATPVVLHRATRTS